MASMLLKTCAALASALKCFCRGTGRRDSGLVAKLWDFMSKLLSSLRVCTFHSQMVLWNKKRLHEDKCICTDSHHARRTLFSHYFIVGIWQQTLVKTQSLPNFSFRLPSCTFSHCFPPTWWIIARLWSLSVWIHPFIHSSSALWSTCP